jgi:glucose uptake protein GlcU
MSEYYNLIQVICGVLAVVFVFLGIFLSVKKLNPEKYETVPLKMTIISTALIIIGLLLYGVVRTCTNLTVVTEEHYDVSTVYLVSLGEVIKMFGFIVFVPLLFKLFKPRTRRPESSSEENPGETE